MFAEYVLELIGLSLWVIALITLPVRVVTDRQTGVLRRLATTPARVPPPAARRWAARRTMPR